MFSIMKENEPSHSKICLRTYADSEGIDQPAMSDHGLYCPLTEIMYEWRAKARMILCACAE